MTTTARRWIGAVLLVAAGLLAGACGQGGPAAVDPTATPLGSPPVSTPTASPGADRATPRATPTGTAAGTPAATAAPVPSPSVPGGIRLTPEGFGPLEIGMSAAAATGTGFIGSIGPGCELSGTRSARLRPPLAAGDARGAVTFADGALAAVTIRGGAATAEGVAVGHTLAQVRSAHGTGRVEVNRTTEDTFGLWVVTVTRTDGGTYDMAVDPGSRQVTQIAVPHLQFCE